MASLAMTVKHPHHHRHHQHVPGLHLPHMKWPHIKSAADLWAIAHGSQGKPAQDVLLALAALAGAVLLYLLARPRRRGRR